MKIFLVTSLIATLCVLGCSKASSSKSNGKSLIPATAAEIIASPDYKLERTTKSGLKCYTRALTPEAARAIPQDSPEQENLHGDDKMPYFLLVRLAGPRGFGVRRPSAAFGRTARVVVRKLSEEVYASQSGRGLPHSKTLARCATTPRLLDGYRIY